MIISVTVAHPKGQRCFKARVHQSFKPASLKLSPTEFYGKYGKVPAGTHHELEIERPLGDVLKALHVHFSERSGEPFMCYPLPIPTSERAQELFEIWCLGSVMTLDHQVDMNTVFSKECGDDEAKFRQVVQERFGLSIARSLTAP